MDVRSEENDMVLGLEKLREAMLDKMEWRKMVTIRHFRNSKNDIMTN